MAVYPVEMIKPPFSLHSMISVLPNGGRIRDALPREPDVALDDISATEWRLILTLFLLRYPRLHSMISVLPNGGLVGSLINLANSCCTR